MKPSTKQIELLHETIGVVRRFYQSKFVLPYDVKTVTEVGEPNRVECICEKEVIVTAEINEDILTIKMNYKLEKTE